MAKRKSKTQKIDPHASDPRDRCYTPAYAYDPIAAYVPPGVIWESADGEGHLSSAMRAHGRDVIGTELRRGGNFFQMSPPDGCAAQVTNPPYSSKYLWIEESYRKGLPFALLMPLETLGAWSAQKHFRQHGVEIMLLSRRVNFYMPVAGLSGGGANFPVAWFCWRILPAPIMYGTITPRPDGQRVMEL